MTPGVCRAAAIALTGIEGTPVLVEAAISQQLPGMAIIGLPDTALAEAKLRVRTATAQAGFPLPPRFLTVNLSPAALPKHGSGFDLAIALSALAASGVLPQSRLPTTAHIGELGLDSGLRRPAGLLSAVIAARSHGYRTVMVPRVGGTEAALVPDIEVIEVGDLAEAVAWHRGEPVGRSANRKNSPDAAATAASPETVRSELPAERHERAVPEPDMSDVIGQPEAVQALTVAAAGRHHLSLVGPPGSGKTLLATRLPTILPDLTPEESLVASSIASLGGSPLTRLVDRPPFEDPHHTASRVSIFGGGGSGGLQPGALTRACYGILLLDEAPEFRRDVLEQLRQPLETGTVKIHRASFQATLPAHTQLVLSANPCPCGNADSLDEKTPCRCSPVMRVRYLQKISGPLNDRIDLRLTVRRVSTVLMGRVETDRPSSRELRQRVGAARERAAWRLADTPWTVNGEVPSYWFRSESMLLPRAATAVLDHAYARGALTLRGYDRVLRIAWTLADLAEKDRPDRPEVAQALALRNGATP